VHDAFTLVSRWHIPAPLDAAWALLRCTRDWPQWWPYVYARKPWLRRLARGLRPLYVWNHAAVMHAGEAGLIAYLVAARRG